jgi:hypothetical protein
MSASKCTEKGCPFFARHPLTVCSGHTEEGKALTAAKREEEAVEKARMIEELKEGRAWWNAHRPPLAHEGRYLILGAAPHEGKRGRDYYDDPNVFLLGHELKNHRGIDYSRYLQADYSPAAEDGQALMNISEEYAEQFDEIAFDWSTMCSFYGKANSIVHIFQYFYNMLKEDGVFFLPDYTTEIESALESIGFLVKRVRIADLGGNTIVNRLKIEGENTPVVVAIKRSGSGSGNGVNHGGRRKKMRKSRKKRKTRKYSRVVRK